MKFSKKKKKLQRKIIQEKKCFAKEKNFQGKELKKKKSFVDIFFQERNFQIKKREKIFK